MIRIYTSEECVYCNDLKTKLQRGNIEYTDIDVDNDKNREHVDKLYEFVGKPIIPIIIKKPHILIPTRSFNTIDEAIELIKSLE
jgi:glutaredoxin